MAGTVGGMGAQATYLLPMSHVRRPMKLARDRLKLSALALGEVISAAFTSA